MARAPRKRPAAAKPEAAAVRVAAGPVTYAKQKVTVTPRFDHSSYFAELLQHHPGIAEKHNAHVRKYNEELRRAR